ncbi:MAG: trimethylamine methyltransferase family protein, partial [Gemmatimonadota bacterium]
IAAAVDGGGFLALDHTAAHFRDQFWFPRLLDRQRYAPWAGGGGKTMGERVRERVSALIAEHRAPALDRQTAAQLDRIVAGE